MDLRSVFGRCFYLKRLTDEIYIECTLYVFPEDCVAKYVVSGTGLFLNCGLTLHK